MPSSKTLLTVTSIMAFLLLGSHSYADNKTLKKLKPASVHKVPSPAMVKRCHDLTLSDPMADYKVASYDPSTGKTPLNSNGKGFYCKKIKKYDKPFCRKHYKLAMNKCIKILGKKKLK